MEKKSAGAGSVSGLLLPQYNDGYWLFADESMHFRRAPEGPDHSVLIPVGKGVSRVYLKRKPSIWLPLVFLSWLPLLICLLGPVFDRAGAGTDRRLPTTDDFSFRSRMTSRLF